MKRTWVLGLGVCGAILVGGAGLIVSAAFALTRPVGDASERFLSLIAERKTGQAYAAASRSLRAQMAEVDFGSAVERLGLAEYASASWRNRTVENSTGLAEGFVATKKGGATPVSIRLIWEDDAWKVLGLKYGGIDLAAAAPPRAGEIERLISQTLLDFNSALTSRDFTAFHSTLSEAWKKQSTPKSLIGSFQEFIDKKIDIGLILHQKPRITSSQHSSADGTLKLKGRYATKPSPVDFGLEYASENGDWKLLRISVSVGGED